jgi:3-hydroxyisobutyrate dehydrogenase-like beta-hydroxyacid dehydrogenase
MAHGEMSAVRSSLDSGDGRGARRRGTMGFAMARNIARAGIAVRAWNRTRAKAEPLADDGAYIADTAPDAAGQAGIPRVQPIFDAVGQRTIRAGQAGAGTRLKLVTNSWVLAVVESGAETIALAERLGVDPALFFQAIEKGPLDLPYLRTEAKAIAERDFRPSFRLRLAAKDARLVTDAAWQHGLDLRLLELIARRLGQGVGAHGDEYFSATYLASAR